MLHFVPFNGTFRYNIEGFPTIKFFPAGSADPEPYEVRVTVTLMKHSRSVPFVMLLSVPVGYVASICMYMYVCMYVCMYAIG